jgi:hypothetical protein
MPDYHLPSSVSILSDLCFFGVDLCNIGNEKHPVPPQDTYYYDCITEHDWKR